MVFRWDHHYEALLWLLRTHIRRWTAGSGPCKIRQLGRKFLTIWSWLWTGILGRVSWWTGCIPVMEHPLDLFRFELLRLLVWKVLSGPMQIPVSPNIYFYEMSRRNLLMDISVKKNSICNRLSSPTVAAFRNFSWQPPSNNCGFGSRKHWTVPGT